MPNLENSTTIQNLLNILIKVIGRRTTKNLAITIVSKSIKQLQTKYDFLKHIDIEDASYTEKRNDITVGQEINNIEQDEMEKIVDEIFDTVFKSLGRNVGFYYIKEIQDDIENEIGTFFKEYDVNLNIKQQEHLISIMESSVIKIQEIKNSEIFEIILAALVRLLKIKKSETFTKETIMDTIHRLEEKHDFLKNISINEIRDPHNPYEYKIDPEIDNVVIAERGEVIQKLLEEIGKSSDTETRRFIGEKFEMLLGKRDLSKLQKLGVKLDEINMTLIREGHQLLLNKVFEAVIDVIDKNLSKEFAIKYLENLLEKIQERHEILKYIQVDKSKFNDGIKAINISSEINAVDSDVVGKAIRDVLGRVQIDLKDVTRTFVHDFEITLGRDYLKEIEKIGVNMHLLELRTV